MTILRTDTVSGIGGRNAITGSVEFITSYGYLSTTLDVIGTSDFTIEWWFKAEDRSEPGTANRRMFRLGANNATGSISINYDAVNNDIQWNYDAATILAASTIKVYDNSWYHIAAVREGTGSNETKLYINGVLSDTGTLATDLTQTALQIGWDSTLGNDFGFYGFISDFRVTKSAVYTAAFTPPIHKLAAIPNTILLCCQDSNDVTVDAVGKTITSGGTPGPKATNITPSVGKDDGTVLEGDITFDSLNYMTLPKGITTQSNRGRALFGGGYLTPSGYDGGISYLEMQSSGNTIDFGDLSVSRGIPASNASSTRGIWGGGGVPGGVSDVIDYVTINTTGNAADFGNLTSARQHVGACSSPTRGVWAGGGTPTRVKTIDYVTIATTANATNFGDLTVTTMSIDGLSSNTRGLFAAGTTPTMVNTIEYVTIASESNATDFGDLITVNSHYACTSNGIKGIWAGGYDGSGEGYNLIEFVTIATTGNAQDWGDTYRNRKYHAGCSDSHGGLSE